MRSLLQELVSLATPSACRKCDLKNSLRILRQLRSSQCSPLRARFASTLASSTAINAPREIPPAFQELHQALEKLKRDAPSYVNLSRLQLALRGLESSAPVTRIAVLGVDHQKSARHLVRLLLADPLTDEGDWERKLEAFSSDDQRGLLLRYGDDRDPPNINNLVTTIHVPSRTLLRHNLEILISTISLPSHLTSNLSQSEALKSAALVPTAEAPKSFSGSISFITYPVHRAIVLSEGLPGLLTLGRFISDGTEAKSAHSPLKFAVQLPPLADSVSKDSTPSDMAVLDMDLAKRALSKIRESTSNAKAYEQGWYSSGMPSLTSWFSSEIQPSADSNVLHPAVAELILDVLASASKSLADEHEVKIQATLPATVPDTARGESLAEALKVWSLRAHTEMRDKLDAAFASGKWAKLKWWKLVWRVDDVTMIAEELVQRCWLVDAEKGIIWLAGRAVEAGLHDTTTSSPAAPTTPLPSDSTTTAASPSQPPIQPTSTPLPTSPSAPPWPPTIPLARTNLLTTSIPPLASLAQRLLLQTLSITSLSGALSALFYLSFPATSLYSVGAITALGFVLACRRLQVSWEEGRKGWEGEVRERGRKVLRELEEGYEREIASKEDEGRRVKEIVVVEGEGERMVAGEAVEEVRSALQKVV